MFMSWQMKWIHVSLLGTALASQLMRSAEILASSEVHTLKGDDMHIETGVELEYDRCYDTPADACYDCKIRTSSSECCSSRCPVNQASCAPDPPAKKFCFTQFGCSGEGASNLFTACEAGDAAADEVKKVNLPPGSGCNCWHCTKSGIAAGQCTCVSDGMPNCGYDDLVGSACQGCNGCWWNGKCGEIEEGGDTHDPNQGALKFYDAAPTA